MKKLLVLTLVIVALPLLSACENMGDAGSYGLTAPSEETSETSAAKSTEATSSTPAPDLWTADDPVWGDMNAPMSMVVFSDFQCPYCGDFFLTLEKLKPDWIDTKKLKIQYRDFPLTLHRNALPAHLAANAAAQQGRYLEMHRVLFEHQRDWEKSEAPEKLFEQYAQELKMGLAEYQGALKDPALAAEIQEDKSAGQTRGISGTPGFFLNDKAYEGAISYEDLLKLLAAIK